MLNLALILSLLAIHEAKKLNIAVVTDTHIGESCNGNLSYEACKPSKALADVVAKMNELRVDGVFITGDITGSALLEEFQMVREILNGLQMPWWPLLGNHDSWPYSSHNGTFNQTDTPIGDQYFADVFGDILKTNGIHDVPDVSATTGWVGEPCLNQNYPTYNSFYHNFEVSFPSFSSKLKIVCLDWVSRKAALPEAGVGPEVELHDFEGGTFQWFNNYLNQLSAGDDKDSKIFIMQHHPFHNRDILDPFGLNRFYNFTFDKYQDSQVQTLMSTYFPNVNKTFIGTHAGHMHRWFSGKAFTQFTASTSEWLTMPAFETPASKGWWVNSDYVSSFQVFQFELLESNEVSLQKSIGYWKVPEKDSEDWQNATWHVKPVNYVPPV